MGMRMRMRMRYGGILMDYAWTEIIYLFMFDIVVSIRNPTPYPIFISI